MFNLFFAIISALAGAFGGVAPKAVMPTPPAGSYFSQSACYQVEPDFKLAVTQADLDSVHTQYPSQPTCYQSGADQAPVDPPNGLIGDYTLIRRDIQLIPYKVKTEGEPFSGGCDLKSAIRWVGSKPDGTKIYWEPANHNEQDLRQFVEVFTKMEGKNFVFDVYAKDTILNNLPSYITNCKESGGLVPVDETNTNIVPPQTVPMADFLGDQTTNPYWVNYQKKLLEAPDSFPTVSNYLIKIDKEPLPKAADPDGLVGIYKTTINTKDYIYDVFYHVGAFYLRDQADRSVYVYDPTEEKPPSNKKHDPSLQLGALRFKVVNSWTVFTPVCKPAIYLYPQTDTNLKVSVHPVGKLTSSIPEYGDGWNVKAYKNGMLEENGKTYPYLFYEADLTDGYKPDEGWTVAKNDIPERLDSILISLGLNSREKSDFLDYWLPKLKEKPYYFIGLVPSGEVNMKEPLSLSLKPDTFVRIRLLFEGLDAPISVKTPQLPKVTRNGFTLVDWGGSLVGETCNGVKIH